MKLPHTPFVFISSVQIKDKRIYLLVIRTTSTTKKRKTLKRGQKAQNYIPVSVSSFLASSAGHSTHGVKMWPSSSDNSINSDDE
jgi:hypothetical protein